MCPTPGRGFHAGRFRYRPAIGHGRCTQLPAKVLARDRQLDVEGVVVDDVERDHFVFDLCGPELLVHHESETDARDDAEGREPPLLAASRPFLRRICRGAAGFFCGVGHRFLSCRGRSSGAPVGPRLTEELSGGTIGEGSERPAPAVAVRSRDVHDGEVEETRERTTAHGRACPSR